MQDTHKMNHGETNLNIAHEFIFEYCQKVLSNVLPGQPEVHSAKRRIGY